MGDHDRRQGELPLEPLDLDLHVETQILVEGGEGLVEKQDARADGEGPGERDALLLAARELARLALGKALHADGGQHLPDAIRLHGTALAAGREAIGDVLRHGHVRKERVVLEDDADLAAVRRQFVDGAVADHHLAVGLLDEAGHDPEQRGLAAARGAEQGHEFAALHLERHVVDGEPRAIAVRHAIQRQRLGRGHGG